MVDHSCPQCGRFMRMAPGSTLTCPDCGFQGEPPREAASGTAPASPFPETSPSDPAPPPSGSWGTPPPGWPQGGGGLHGHGGHVKPFGGFWIRVVAAFIDTLVIVIPYYLLLMLLFPEMAARAVDPDAPFDPMESLLSLLVGWLYAALLESSRFQATVGKMAVGLKVTALDGRRISFGRATGRHFASILSAMILLIGYFMIGWTQRKQGLHDKIAGTLVYKNAYAPPPDVGAPPPF
jgi:uncharacterized RDD family membrane protein YckC